jgi:hypothetical protein
MLPIKLKRAESARNEDSGTGSNAEDGRDKGCDEAQQVQPLPNERSTCEKQSRLQHVDSNGNNNHESRMGCLFKHWK